MSNEHEKTPDQKALDELAERVGMLVTAEPIQRRILGLLSDLLLGVRKDVFQGALESLLIYRSRVSRQRDEEWARVLAVVFQTAEAEVPTTDPYKFQEWLVAKQQERERTLGKTKYSTGASEGWRLGIAEGVKRGFGASEIGKSLDAALEAAKSAAPKF